VVVAVILALLLSSWTALLVIVLVLAAYQILITVVGRAHADPIDAIDPVAPPAASPS
jgi:hypothetical protein